MLPTLSQSIRLSTPRDGVKSSFDCRTISHSLPSPTTMRRLGYEARTDCSSSNPKEWTSIPSACAAGERPIWRHPPSHSIDCEAFSRKRQPLHTRSRKHNETDHSSIPLFFSSLSLDPLPLPFLFLLQTPIHPNAPLRMMAETLHPISYSNPDPSSCTALTVPNAARHSLPFDNEISTFPRSFVLLSSFPCLSSERFEVLWIS